MISRNIYFNITVRVLLIVALSLFLGYLAFKVNSMRLIIIFLIMLTAITINLVSYLNRTNRKIGYFFEAVRNDESNLSFPVKTSDTDLREIYKGMNRLNQQLQQLKIEISQQEQFFKTLMEHLACGILTYNEKGFIHHANSAAKRLLSLEVLTHLKQIERLDRGLYNEISELKPSERRLAEVNTNRGRVQLSLRTASFRADNNELMILSIQDIKNELDEKELESWMKLIRVLMHEIMNSITPITSLSESLANIYYKGGKNIKPGEITDKSIVTTVKGLNVIQEQGKGLMSFVESFRKLTRLPEPEKSYFRTQDLLDRVQVLFNSLENRGDTVLTVEMENPDLELFADQNLISQVLINLVKNSVEANIDNPGAVIIINACIGSNNHPEICVTDNGPGISEENLEQIFVPFFTTRENGTGIGLSISKQIMSAHGGSLKVRSTPGVETVFCMSFQER